MKAIKTLIIIMLIATVSCCGSKSNAKKKYFSLTTNAKTVTKLKKTLHTIANNQTLNLSINNPKKRNISKVAYQLDGKPITAQTHLKSVKLGTHIVKATVSYEDATEVIAQTITVLSSTPAKLYTFKIINTYPHDINSYTQGLEFYNGYLYESTGQRGKSKLRKVAYKTGKVLKDIDLDKTFFGEGLSILNNKLYQLTWQSGKGFVYDIESFKRLSSFKYGASKEGWGLCNDGKMLYKSDGTENIWLLNPNTLVEEDHIEVYTNKGKIGRLNELEWVNGKIYANIYQKDGVAIVNPENGVTEAVINFSELKKKVKQHPQLDVLNGIAYNPDTKTFFITGKHWDTLFEVEIIKK